LKDMIMIYRATTAKMGRSAGIIPQKSMRPLRYATSIWNGGSERRREWSGWESGDMEGKTAG